MSEYLPLDDLKTYIKSLEKIPYLNAFDGEYIEEMFNASELREYETGEAIITEGALDRSVYFLLVGEVQVLKEGVEVARIDRYGEIFGEQALIDNQARSASVVAVTPCYCMAVDATFLDKLEPPAQTACVSVIHRMCAHVLSDRLKKTTAELAHVEKELENLKKGK